MRIIVCGGRKFDNPLVIRRMLVKLHAERTITHLFHGNASGTDTEADRWVRDFPKLGIKVFPCPAEWRVYGKAAGPIRNKQMLGNGIDLVLAFPGGRGTRNMMKQARRAHVEVLEVTGAMVLELESALI